MIEAGSHELQVTLIYGGRGHVLDAARANALNAVNIDPRLAADISLIRLIFCGTLTAPCACCALRARLHYVTSLHASST